MKYAVWAVGVFILALLQVALNNYLPAYLAPDLFLMLIMYMTLYYGYYTTLLGIVVLSYISSVFSSGSVWFFMFSYVSVFYLLNFFKKYFDRKQIPAIVTLSLLTTLAYSLFVLPLSVFAGKTALFGAAIRLGLIQAIANIAAACLIFKYVPRIDRRIETGVHAAP